MKLLQSHIMTCTCACMERVTYVYMCMYGESNIRVHVHVHVWRVCSNPVQANSEWRDIFSQLFGSDLCYI